MNTFTQLHADLAKRDALGLNTYGKELMPFDGRDTLEDAREEALDLLVYLTKAKQEMAAKDEAIRELIELLECTDTTAVLETWRRQTLESARAALGGSE